MQQRILNIDALVSERVNPAIVINGKRHELKPASLQNFIDTMNEIEALGTEPSLLKEIEVTVKIVKRAFPTMTEEEVGNLPFDMLSQIANFARGAGEEIVTDNAEKAAEAEASGNPQTAS